MVVAAPTFRPQAALSRDRLLARLATGRRGWRRAPTRDGYAVQVGRASARFLSAAPGANARGQTADLLLVANEAQDIQPEVWDAVFDPMAAATNATTLFLGTVWSRETLLARQMRYLEELERRDGERRVWRVPWEEVARDLPAYGERVRARIAQFGSGHPFIRTEYCLEELEGEGGLFPPQRLAQMRGDHPRAGTRRSRASATRCCSTWRARRKAGPVRLAFVDGSRRDSTALTVVEVEESGSRAVEEKDDDSARLLDSSTADSPSTGWSIGWRGRGCGTRRCTRNWSIWRGMSGGRAWWWSMRRGSGRGWPRSWRRRWGSGGPGGRSR